MEEKEKAEVMKQRLVLTLAKDDPLFGVLSEEQVGMDINTGRRKINAEVLQQMREFILAADGGEKRVRQERVRKSVSDLYNDPMGQKTFLRLESRPSVTNEVDKGKGIVFQYPTREENHGFNVLQLCGSSFNAVEGRLMKSPECTEREADNTFFFDCSTGFSSGIPAARSSGTTKLMQSGRHRPPKKYRRRMSQHVSLTELFGQNDSRRGSFRFDKRMVGRQKVRECIDSAWKECSGAGQQSVIDKLGSVRRSLGK
ncbi:hypothetical protein DY000_02031937 [Brassica cretica]|uniref:Uncharacterized protein n=1 Tax=Brassica cretica TaxID=69181 RepID=A0ABQ7DYD4_BRACR|nr:hypothetical protein DY000_02031937 [Brassica cretica]